MDLKNEIEVYDKAKVSIDTGEIESWDRVIFPIVIRKRQIELILKAVDATKPSRILDFGCGAGWLSIILSSRGYRVVGIDVSSSLIKSAATSCPEAQFVIGDCMSLPFRDNSFDFIIGIGILHHLNTVRAVAECQRVATKHATLLFMEPNKLNPFAALGRKILPLDVCTKGETPFSPRALRKALSVGGGTIQMDYLFPYSFALAYLLGKTKWRDNKKLKVITPLLTMSERLLEKIPIFKQLSWTLVGIKRMAHSDIGVARR
jgi:ubiquinone/menaquinone biosynthesis C-methylase UbiE